MKRCYPTVASKPAEILPNKVDLAGKTLFHRSIPCAGLFAGLKLSRLSPAKCPAKSPAKKNCPAKIQTRTPPSSLMPGHIMIEIPYSDVIKDVLIIMWPGKNLNRRSKLRNLGVWV